MARYRTGENAVYRDGFWFPPYSEIEVPDDVEPAPTWTRLDEPGPKGKRSQPQPQEPLADDKPKRGRGGRRSQQPQEPQADEAEESEATDEEEAPRPSDREI